jgi:hypothetical protein
VGLGVFHAGWLEADCLRWPFASLVRNEQGKNPHLLPRLFCTIVHSFPQLNFQISLAKKNGQVYALAQIEQLRPQSFTLALFLLLIRSGAISSA